MKKHITIILLTAVLSAISFFTVFASDYFIQEAWWDEDYNGGNVKAGWEPCELKTTYRITVYKNKLNSQSSSLGTMVLKNKQTSAKSYDCSEIIRDNGTGIYTFTVYPVKGDSSEDLVQSDVIEIDSTYLAKIKAAHPKETNTKNTEKNAGSARGWLGNPDGSWTYAKDNGTFAKNEWVQSGNYWYYFNASGFMLTGWQYIGNCWYYLEPNKGQQRPLGAMYASAVTPDGYTVNESGQWIQDGAVVHDKGNYTGQASAADSTLKSVTVSYTVNGNNANFSAGSSVSVKSATINPTPDQWKAGQNVTTFLTLEAKNGYKFDGNTKFSMSNGTITSNQGDNKTRNLTVSFKPNFKLEAPANFYISELDGHLHWDKVEGAKRYKVTIKEYDTSVFNSYVTTNSVDISEWIYELEELEITVQACGPDTKNSGITSSSAVTVELSENMISLGSFRQVGNSLYYYEFDERVKNEWRDIMGYRYHFSRSGAAEKGWYHDPDGGWYYFDQDGRMLTDTVTPDGYTVNSEGKWVVDGIPQV